MNTKLIMTVSAVAMGSAGIALSFLPQEISQLLQFESSSVQLLMLQLFGALYFAFAMLNWTAKENLIGGIYGRPIAIGNLTHFVIGALALIKNAAGHPMIPIVWIAALIYALFAAAFSYIFFQHPDRNK